MNRLQKVLDFRGRSNAAVVISTTGVTFLSSFFSGALTLLLPTIQRDLSISDAELVWPLALNALTLACFLPLAGRLADVYGRRLVFLLGTVHFTLLTLAFSLAPNLVGLSVTAALLGFGPACFVPAAVGILGSTFHGPVKTRAFAALGAGQPLGFILGLFLAAFFASTSWRIAFYLQTSLSAIFCCTSYISLPKNQEVAERDRSIDWIGAALATTGLIMLNFALTDSQSAPKCVQVYGCASV
jgi:MFS family permease